MEELDYNKVAASYHEAGHIMGYWLYYGNLDHITGVVLCDEDRGDARIAGKVDVEEYDKSGYDINTEEGYRFWLGQAVFVAGGPVMMYMYTRDSGFVPKAGDGFDIPTFMCELEKYQGITDDSIVEGLLAKGRDWIKPRLWEHRETVKRLAKAIYEKERLSKDEILEVLNEKN